jgi:hypothetical protein
MRTSVSFHTCVNYVPFMKLDVKIRGAAMHTSKIRATFFLPRRCTPASKKVAKTNVLVEFVSPVIMGTKKSHLRTVTESMCTFEFRRNRNDGAGDRTCKECFAPFPPPPLTPDVSLFFVPFWYVHVRFYFFESFGFPFVFESVFVRSLFKQRTFEQDG